MIAPHDLTYDRRRSRRFRCSALLWAVVFLLSGVQSALAAVECPHHVVAEQAAEAGPAAHHHHHEGDGDHGSDDGGHTHLCTCVGPCHLSGLQALPQAADGRIVAEVFNVAPQPAAAHAEALPGRPHRLLPFATAPPRAC